MKVLTSHRWSHIFWQ